MDQNPYKAPAETGNARDPRFDSRLLTITYWASMIYLVVIAIVIALTISD